MDKYRLKQVLWVVAVILLIASGLWGFGIAGEGLSRARQGVDPASALNLPPEVPEDAMAMINWLPDDTDTGREMEPFTRRQIQSAYLRAWSQWNQSLADGTQDGLKSNFAGPGLNAVEKNLSMFKSSGYKIEQRNLAHSLQLHFYSADGSIVAFSDTTAIIWQQVVDRNNQIITAEKFEYHYDVIMFLEDGNWRIRHWVRALPDS